MNSILLNGCRTSCRRFLFINNNGCCLKTGSLKRNSTKSNQQTTNQQINQFNKHSRNIALAGIAVGGLLSSYFFINSFKKPKLEVVKEDAKSLAIKPQIEDLPEEIEFLIIGGGSAAFAALRTIRAREGKSKVIVVSEENSYPYMKPPLSKELLFAEPELKKDFKFRRWDDKERSLFYAHDEFYFNLKQLNESETGGVAVLKGHKVVKIDPYDQYVILDNGQLLKYGKCLIATGSKLIESDLEKNANEQVKQRIIKLHSTEDFRNLDRLADQNKSFALIGSEFLASELSCALTKRSKGEVIQIMEGKGNLTSVLPAFLSEWTSECLQKEGLKQITGTQVKSTEFKNNKVILNLSNGQTIKTDYLIIDNGSKPNTELAKTGELEICPLNDGLLVNAELQARTNLWVAGDVASFYDVKLGRRRIPAHDNSLITGRLAGENMTGGHKIFWHQPIIWSDLGTKIGFEALGLIDPSLPTISVFTKPEKDDSTDAKNDPNKELAIKLPNKSDDYNKGVVFYVKEGTVVGLLLWNVFSKTSLARRIINENKSYEDLAELAKLFELHKNDFDDLEE